MQVTDATPISKRRWNKNYLPLKSISTTANRYVQLIATHTNPSQPYGARAWDCCISPTTDGQGFLAPNLQTEPLELMIYVLQLPPVDQSLVPVLLLVQAAVSSASLVLGEPGIVRLEKPMTACPMQCSSKLSS